MEILNAVVNHPQTYLLLVARASGLFLLAPVLGHTSVPALMRVALVLLVAWVLFPIYGVNTPDPLIDLPSLITALGGEIVIGLTVGMVASLILTAFTMAGNVVGNQMGFGFLALFDPASENRAAVIDQFYSIIGTLVFLVINGHHLVLQAFDHTFRAIPLGGIVQPDAVAMPLGQIISEVFAAAFLLALPVTAALLITDVALGLAVRAVPQLNVLFVGAPLKVLIGLLALSLALPALIASMEAHVDSGIRSAVNLAGAL